MKLSPSEETLLQLDLLKAELEQINRIREFLKKLPPGRKLYLNLGSVLVESNFLEVTDYLNERERKLKAQLLELEGKLTQKGLF